MAKVGAVPPAHSFAWTTVEALRELGGSGSVSEINEHCVKLRGLTEKQQEIPHKVGSRTEIEYRLAWARTLCKNLGLLVNSKYGVWALTDLGAAVTEEQVEEAKKQRRKVLAAKQKAKAAEAADVGVVDDQDVEDLDDQIEEEEPDWKTALLECLKAMDPGGFERLATRLLREAGFVNVTVTGRPGDGGIDGVGVYRMSLVSFPVYFQCKRYAKSVGSAAVRDFRGAMAGRGDKGLLITTATFTADAKAEATRDGAPPIDLIDGDRLADLLREYSLGVTSVPRTVYDVTVHEDFFSRV